MEIKAVLVKRCGLEIASFMRSYAKRKPTIRFNPERCTANADKGVKTGERGKERLYRERTRQDYGALSIFIPSVLVLISRLLIVRTLLTRASTDLHRKGKVRYNRRMRRFKMREECTRNASWDEEETANAGYDEGHEYCVNEREVNHSDQTIKTMSPHPHTYT